MGKMFLVVCMDLLVVFMVNFFGNFKVIILIGFKVWVVDVFYYVVFYVIILMLGIVVVGLGVFVDLYGKLLVDMYYDMVLIQVQDMISIDLIVLVLGYYIVLNFQVVIFVFINLQFFVGKVFCFMFYFEQGIGNNIISFWDLCIKWVGLWLIFVYIVGFWNVIELEIIDG